MVEKENKKEREVRQALEAHLDPSEELLTYTRGKSHHIGLTAKRLILLPLKWWGWGGKPSGKVFSIRRESVKSLEWSGLWSRMRIRLPQGNMDIHLQSSRWKKRAKELIELATQAALPPPADTATAGQRHLQQARDFQELGFLASAQHELSEAIQIDPALSMDPSVASLREQLAETRLALRAGAMFVFADMGVRILFVALLAIFCGGQVIGEFFREEGFYLVLFLIVGFKFGTHLWQGRKQWRSWETWVALGLFIILGLVTLAEGELLYLISKAAFFGSFALVLTGKSNRTRTWVAIGIYAIGYLGLTLFLMLFPILILLVSVLIEAL